MGFAFVFSKAYLDLSNALLSKEFIIIALFISSRMAYVRFGHLFRNFKLCIKFSLI